MTILDTVIRFGRALTSTIGGGGGVLVEIGGVGSLDPEDTDELEAEQGTQEAAWGALGVVARPLPPEAGETPLQADVVCLVTSEGLTPIAWRDLRLEKAFPAGIKEGSTALAGYGGGFVVLDLAEASSGSKRPNIMVAYMPYEFASDGTPSKAMSVIMDPAEQAITITHGDGYQYAITPQGHKWFTPDGGTFGSMSDSEILFHAPKITLKGNVALGAQAEVGVPLLPGAASPAGPSVFISPV